MSIEKALPALVRHIMTGDKTDLAEFKYQASLVDDPVVAKCCACPNEIRASGVLVIDSGNFYCSEYCMGNGALSQIPQIQNPPLDTHNQ